MQKRQQHFPVEPNRRIGHGRDKVVTACESCRTRKRKCSGHRPRCKSCQESGEVCRWPIDTRRFTGISKDYVQRLESRVRDLQQQQSERDTSQAMQLPNDQQDQRTGTITSPALESSQQRAPAPSAQYTDNATHVRAESISNSHVNRSIVSPADSGSASHPLNSDNGHVVTRSGQDTVDAALNNSRTKGFFGMANIGNFVSFMLRTIEGEREVQEDVQPFPASGGRAIPSTQAPGAKSRFCSAIPPRKTADSLLFVYFKYIHPIFPFLDQVEVTEEYENLWTGSEGGRDDQLFTYTLNLIFALSAQLSADISPEERSKVAKTFYARAQEAMAEDIWNLGTFSSIQALLLLVQYWHTSDPHQCWIAVSITVRNAQALGLHLPETSARMPSLRTKNLARRVWYGCITMDRIAAMTFGRPTIINGDAAVAVPRPLPLDDGDLRESDTFDTCADTNVPSTMDFFIESIKLYEILHDILNCNSSPPQSVNTAITTDYEHYILPLSQGSRKSILLLDHNLTAFMEQLPSHLQVSPLSTDGGVFARQAIMTRQRYLHMRIILLRPTLCRMIAWQRDQPEESGLFNNKDLQANIMLQCAIACVDTAVESIKLIRQCSPSNASEVGLLHAWSYNLLYIYTASTIIIAGRYCRPFSVHLSESALIAAWIDALALLETYQQYGPSAKRLAQILLALDQRVSSHVTRRLPDTTFPGAQQSDVSVTSLIHSSVATRNEFSSQPAGMDVIDFDMSLFDMTDFSWLNEIPMLNEI